MLVRIANEPRDYAWGSNSAISALLGTTPTGRPEAELWLGAHPGSPARLDDGSLLSDWIAADPVAALGAGRDHLPFLLKVLAASAPLSLQAHPTPEQARAGFERENAAGIALDSPERNYKDPYAKPELIYALSPSFDALCGFRPLDQSRAIVAALFEADAARPEPQPQPLEDLLGLLDRGLPETVEWLVTRATGVATLVSVVGELAAAAPTGFEREFATVRELGTLYPGDPGIVLSLLLNRVTLSAGEALYLPPGNIHAYLRGVGIELMSASDNVLRGGLTPKHVDVRELLSVLDIAPAAVPYLRPSRVAAHVELFRPGVAEAAGSGVLAAEAPDFVLLRFDGAGHYRVTGPAIALCTEGSVTLSGSPLARGQSVYVTPDEGTVTVSDGGVVFLATTGG